MRFLRLFDLGLFGFVCFFFLSVSGWDGLAAYDCGTPWTFLLPVLFKAVADVQNCEGKALTKD